MKRTKLFNLLTACVAAGMLLVPVQSFAGYQEEMDQLNQKQKELEQKQQDTKNTKSNLKSNLDDEKANLDDLLKKIDEAGKKLDEVNIKLSNAELAQQETEGRWKEAENRVASRDKLLKSRVRLMYMNGSVSYLDVLFSATSFGDFLDRFETVASIVGKDRELLDANKKDRDTVAKEKKLRDEQVAQIKSLQAEKSSVRQKMLADEKQKEVKIASMSKKLKDLDNMEEDQDQAVLRIINQKRALRNKQQEEQSRQANPGKMGYTAPAKAYSGGKLGWPVPSSSTITSTFGYRVDPIKNVRKLHKGMDIGAPKGTDIVAAESGVVILASWVNGYGNTVVIDHGNGLSTWYGHIMEGGIKVNEGDTVKRGQKIAQVGSTGDSTGYHLHFEVRNNDDATDPTPYVR